jgi:hypothetical protein
MNVAYVSAFAALGGSVVGGMISGSATWLAQWIQVRAGYRSYQISHREDLFRDFIIAASKAHGQAMVNSTTDLQDLIGIYGLINRMQVLCLPRTIACAQNVVQATVEEYFKPNRTLSDIREMIKNNAVINPLSEFAEAARDELRALASK